MALHRSHRAEWWSGRAPLSPLLVLLAAAQVAVGTQPLKTGAGAYYWSMKNGNPRRTGASPYPLLVNISAGPSWHWHDGISVFRATPLIDDRRNIYLATGDGWVRRFSPAGVVEWEYRSQVNTPLVPCIMDGLLYAAETDGHVLALEMETGQVRWRSKVTSGLALDTGTVFGYQGILVLCMLQPSMGMEGLNWLVLAVRAADGHVMWRFVPDTATFNMMASTTGDGTVVFADLSGGIYRLRIDNGEVVWRSGFTTRTDFTTGGAVIGQNNVVYAVGNAEQEGVVSAYRYSDGQLLWRQRLGVLEGNQAAAVGHLQGDGKGPLSVVVAVGRNPGSPPTIGLPHWTPTFLRTIVHIASLLLPEVPYLWRVRHQPGALIAFDAETGELQWAFHPPYWKRPAALGDVERLHHRFEAMKRDHRTELICLPDSWAAPAISGDGTTIAGFMDGRLYAVRDADGDGKISSSEVQSFQAEDAWLGTPALAPGMLATAPCGGGLYVFLAEPQPGDRPPTAAG